MSAYILNKSKNKNKKQMYWIKRINLLHTASLFRQAETAILRLRDFFFPELTTLGDVFTTSVVTFLALGLFLVKANDGDNKRKKK